MSQQQASLPPPPERQQHGLLLTVVKEEGGNGGGSGQPTAGPVAIKQEPVAAGLMLPAAGKHAAGSEQQLMRQQMAVLRQVVAELQRGEAELRRQVAELQSRLQSDTGSSRATGGGGRQQREGGGRAAAQAAAADAGTGETATSMEAAGVAAAAAAAAGAPGDLDLGGFTVPNEHVPGLLQALSQRGLAVPKAAADAAAKKAAAKAAKKSAQAKPAAAIEEADDEEEEGLSEYWVTLDPQQEEPTPIPHEIEPGLTQIRPCKSKQLGVLEKSVFEGLRLLRDRGQNRVRFEVELKLPQALRQLKSGQFKTLVADYDNPLLEEVFTAIAAGLPVGKDTVEVQRMSIAAEGHKPRRSKATRVDKGAAGSRAVTNKELKRKREAAKEAAANDSSSNPSDSD